MKEGWKMKERVNSSNVHVYATCFATEFWSYAHTRSGFRV
jgi:hypothetical protein